MRIGDPLFSGRSVWTGVPRDRRGVGLPELNSIALRVGELREASVAAATEVLESFPDRYRENRAHGMGAKLGLTDVRGQDGSLSDDPLALIHAQGVDYTSCFQALASALREDATRARSLLTDPSAFDVWSERWLARLPRRLTRGRSRFSAHVRAPSRNGC